MKQRPKHLLVADAGRARMFEVDPGRGVLVHDPVWEIERDTDPARDLVTDRPGRGVDVAEGRHQKGPSTDPQRHEKARFAHAVAEALERQRTQERLESLLVVAPAQMLGDLRHEFSDEVRGLIFEEISKDLAKMKPEEIEDHLPDVFRTGR